jgi:FkbM family methyltransferase
VIQILKGLARKPVAVARNCWQAAARPVYRALNLDVAVIAGYGARVRVDPFTGFGRELLKFGERPTERFTLPLMKIILRAGDTYCDVGAHWGTYVVVGAELVGANGRVVAVEPTRQNRARLMENIAANAHYNVTDEPVAIGESSGTGVLRFRGDSGNLSALQSSGTAQGDAQGCEVTTLAAVLDRNGIQRVRLLKMDIEGGECRASRDVWKYADRFDVIYLEVHPPFENPEDDTVYLYKMLGEGRLLFVADCQGAKLMEVRSREDFSAKLSMYYFISARASCSGDDDFKSLLENFRWRP